MTAFLWGIIIALGLTNLARIYFLGIGAPPERTLQGLAIDLVVDTCFLIWAVVLLAR